MRSKINQRIDEKRPEGLLLIGSGSDWIHGQRQSSQTSKYQYIARCNNFFFEPFAFYGKDISYLFVGGDVFKKYTYYRYLSLFIKKNKYAINTIVSPNPWIDRLILSLHSIDTKIQKYENKDNLKYLTTGAKALLWLKKLGFKDITISNFDHYKKGRGYPFARINICWAAKFLIGEQEKFPTYHRCGDEDEIWAREELYSTLPTPPFPSEQSNLPALIANFPIEYQPNIIDKTMKLLRTIYVDVLRQYLCKKK